MKRIAVAVCVAVALFITMNATADDADYQFRTLTHLKRVPSGSMGFGVWAIVPDVTVAPRRMLVVGGLAWENQSSWVEVMGGALTFTTGRVEPVLNIRSFAKKSRGDVYAETLYNFRTRRVLVTLQTSTATVFAPWLRVGAEADIFAGAGKPSFGFGPRVVVPVPFARKRAILATGLQFRNRGQSPVLRQYLVVRF
jgi:hypothetical protein